MGQANYLVTELKWDGLSDTKPNTTTTTTTGTKAQAASDVKTGVMPLTIVALIAILAMIIVVNAQEDKKRNENT